MTKWTVEDFKKYVGREPERDDLDRCNCDQAGELGHWSCGICEHHLPVFECHDCFVRSTPSRGPITRI